MAAPFASVTMPVTEAIVLCPSSGRVNPAATIKAFTEAEACIVTPLSEYLLQRCGKYISETRSGEGRVEASPPLAQLPIHDRYDTADSPIPIRKKVDVLNLAPDSRRHAAIIEAHRDKKGLVERNPPGAIERVTDLRLKRALLAHREAREAGHEEIG